MSFQTVLSFSVPSLILLTGVVEDLRARKVRNTVVLTCLVIAVISSFFTSSMMAGLLGMAAAFGLFVPLVALRILGAGDLKLMMAFGMATNWETVLAVALYSLLWGAMLGLVRAIIAGQFLYLVKNTLRLTTGDLKPGSSELQLIPYTVALAFGWLSHIFFIRGGGFL